MNEKVHFKCRDALDGPDDWGGGIMLLDSIVVSNIIDSFKVADGVMINNCKLPGNEWKNKFKWKNIFTRDNALSYSNRLLPAFNNFVSKTPT